MDESRELLRSKLHVLLSEWPDAPIENFDAVVSRIRRTGSVAECSRLNDLIERQQVCSVISKWHGTQAVTELTKAIAEASARLHCAMSTRVQSIADFYGIE